MLLLSVPYAQKAGNAAALGGLPPSAFVLAAPSSGRHLPCHRMRVRRRRVRLRRCGTLSPALAR